MAGGYAVGYTGAGQAGQQDWLAQIIRASQPAQANTAAALTQRYNDKPETFQQLATMNGWNQPQSGQPAPAGASPVPGAPAPAGPAVPGPAAGGAVPGTLADLRAQIMGYNPDDKIDKAFQLTKQQGLTSLGMDVEDQLAARGVNVGAATGQDLQSRLTAQLLGPLQAAHAQALASAQGDRLSRLTSLSGMELDQQRMQQEADYRRQRDAADDAARQAQLAMQQRQADQAAKAAEAGLTWQQQQEAWAREDRAKQAQQGTVAGALQSGLLGGGGGGGGDDAAARARALIMGGSGGRTREDLLGGSDAPMTSSGHAMGGGTGLGGGGGGGGFGDPTPGWNSGAGRSGDPKRKPFASTTPPQQEQGGAGTPGTVPSTLSSITSGIAKAGTGAVKAPPASGAPAGYTSTSSFRK